MTNLSSILPRARDIRRAAAAAPKVQAEVEAWRTMLDDRQVDEVSFLGCFKIQTDLAEDADDDADPWVYFTLRSWQAAEYQKIQWFQERKRPAKLRLPKARGTGASSFNIALFGFCRPMRRPGYRTLIIAQDQEESEEHLSRLNDFYEQVDWAALKALGIERETSSKRAIVISFKDPETGRFLGKSRVRVKTARAKGLGRGGGYDAIITTERPHWFEKCKRDLRGFLARLSRTPWSAHIDESSPNGFDSFYQDCLSAEQHKGGYELFFIPSYCRPENYKRFDDDAQRAALKAAMGTSPDHGGPLETEHYERCMGYWKQEGLDLAAAEEKALQFTHWRREEIEGTCGGSVENFCCEHGTTMSEAFQGHDRPVFKTHIVKTWAEAANAVRWTRGDLVQQGTEIAFNENNRGLWIISRMPKDGNVHCFGADLASGRERQAGAGKETDFTDVMVDDVYTGATVAELHAHLWPHDVGAEILKAAWFFRRRGIDLPMRGLIELNMDHGALAQELKRTEAFWGMGEDCLLVIEKKTETTTGYQIAKELGFWTSNKSKPRLLAEMHKLIEEVGKFSPAKEIACPWTWATIQEILRYVYLPRREGGQPELGAESGHDDRVIAKSLALMARDVILRAGDLPLSTMRAMQKIQTAGPMMRFTVEDIPDSARKKKDDVLGAQFRIGQDARR